MCEPSEPSKRTQQVAAGAAARALRHGRPRADEDRKLMPVELDGAGPWGSQCGPGRQILDDAKAHAPVESSEAVGDERDSRVAPFAAPALHDAPRAPRPTRWRGVAPRIEVRNRASRRVASSAMPTAHAGELVRSARAKCPTNSVRTHSGWRSSRISTSRRRAGSRSKAERNRSASGSSRAPTHGSTGGAIGDVGAAARSAMCVCRSGCSRGNPES